MAARYAWMSINNEYNFFKILINIINNNDNSNNIDNNNNSSDNNNK